MLEGLYESLVTRRLRQALDGLDVLMPVTGTVDEADEPEVLSRHVRAAVLRALEGERDPDRRREMVNRILEDLTAHEDILVEAPSQLLSLTRPGAPGQVTLVDRGRRPATPLSEAALLTNAHGEPAMGSELRAEVTSTDHVDLLCAFVKWHGIRLLERELSDLRDRRVRLRVITTTYMGATERIALDRLVVNFGAEVRIQYDALRTRLHAKAWLFRRNTGFDTAYVGSSNLSRAALLDGVEWNVRLSSVATPALLEKFSATFDTYWNDPSFELYNPSTDRDRLDDALAEAGGLELTTASPSGCPDSRSALTRTRHRCSSLWTLSGRSTIDTEISSWPPPARARPSSPPSTTSGSLSRRVAVPSCSSWRTVARSSSSQ